MNSPNQSTDILKRFENESMHIVQYIEFLNNVSGFGDKRLFQLNLLLQKHGFPKYRYRSLPEMLVSFPYFSHQELLTLSDWTHSLEHSILDSLSQAESILRALPAGTFPDDDFEMHEDTFNAIETVDAEFFSKTTPELVSEVRQRIAETLDSTISSKPSNSNWFIHEGVRDQAIMLGTNLWLHERIQQLEKVLAEFEEIQIITRTASPDAEINILRQGFILLMTAFDAALFDLVREALTNKFFSLAGAFGKQEKISMQDLASANSFDNLKMQIIEDQLKKRYVKDLIGLMIEWEVELLEAIREQISALKSGCGTRSAPRNTELAPIDA